MDTNAIRAQSEAAYNQWCVQWREHAKINSQYEMKPLSDLENTGVGKAILCVANGYSFEENIETIKKYQHNVDILACDKTMGNLIDHGIIPKYVMVCDANVNYEKYMKPWKDKLQDTILLSNVCGSVDWPANGNWKEKYFFINQDILESEKEFSAISGCKNFIVAGTNVSNAMVVMLTQCDNSRPANFFGYDKILLIGYDYSWRFGKKYYSFDENGGNKANYMRHQYIKTASGEFAYTSNNLAFSAQWFETYVKTFNLPVIQCTPHSVLTLKTGDLAEQMQYKYKPEDAENYRKTLASLKQVESIRHILTQQLNTIKKDHFRSFLSSV